MSTPQEMPPPGLRHMRSELRMLVRGETHTHRVLRSRLVILAGSTLLLDAVGTVLMYLFEHSQRGSGFDDVGGALFWVTAQLTTVSSQMPNRSRRPDACSTSCSSRNTGRDVAGDERPVRSPLFGPVALS